MVNAYIA